ncbi:MAG: hypothetical protein A2Z93_06270 [Curvibacter sp. GWA2_64_110]|nr:MAG: hypothetical protein A2Z93_06270 [Curvibacter sp. GWA2_64_110]HCY15596.1 hypothetical protein [Curvibacter sp.]
MISKILACSLVFLAASAAAQPGDKSCRNYAGQRINSVECVEFFKKQQPLSDAECYASPTCRAETQARSATREADRQKEVATTRAAILREQAEADAKAARREDAMKTNCGADFNRPRIGMPMARVRECVTIPFKEASQAHTAQGTVVTYQAGRDYIRTLDGKVVEWGTF